MHTTGLADASTPCWSRWGCGAGTYSSRSRLRTSSRAPCVPGKRSRARVSKAHVQIDVHSRGKWAHIKLLSGSAPDLNTISTPESPRSCRNPLLRAPRTRRIGSPCERALDKSGVGCQEATVGSRTRRMREAGSRTVVMSSWTMGCDCVVCKFRDRAYQNAAERVITRHSV